jgi:hypothetical protein
MPWIQPIVGGADPKAQVLATARWGGRRAGVACGGLVVAFLLDILDRLGEQGRLDWSRASLDSASVRTKRGGGIAGGWSERCHG